MCGDIEIRKVHSTITEQNVIIRKQYAIGEIHSISNVFFLFLAFRYFSHNPCSINSYVHCIHPFLTKPYTCLLGVGRGAPMRFILSPLLKRLLSYLLNACKQYTRKYKQ